MPFDLAFRKSISLAGLVLALQGCTISTPYPQLAAADGPVLVVLTQGRLDPALRTEFDRQTRLVVKSLAGQPGLMGYSVRRELLGTDVWTVSIWRHEDALRDFLRGTAHRQAVDRGMPALMEMVSLRQKLAPADVPADWDAALHLLRTNGAKHHWE